MYHVPAGSELDFLSSDLVGNRGHAPDDASSADRCGNFRDSLTQPPAWYRTNASWQAATGNAPSALLSINVLAGSTWAPTGSLIVAQDITARETGREIRLAFYDSLTGRPTGAWRAASLARRQASVRAAAMSVPCCSSIGTTQAARTYPGPQRRRPGCCANGRRLRSHVRDNDLVARAAAMNSWCLKRWRTTMW